MAAFVVISTDNRLSGLVDGIEKCLPLNPYVATHLSTGKIEKKGEDYFYKYRLHNNGEDENESSDFDKLVLNQLSAFRLMYGVNNTLYVFMLENPRSEEEIQTLECWLQGLEKLFTNDVAKQEKNIYICRVLFTYDVEKPCDVTRQLPPDILKNYLERREKLAFKDSSGILCISNRDNIGAAISHEKKEHDLKLPRLLADFMMLLSCDDNAYGVFNAINSAAKCYTLGYAESMYHFPDVREYYKHADMRSLYERILKDPDEAAQLDNDEKAMNIECHPIGLDMRKRWLECKYADVPFDQDIKLHKGSADFIIDNCLLKLKALYCKKREEEMAEVNARIEELDAEYNSMSQEDLESEDEFKARKKEKFKEKESKVKELRNELNRLHKEFPDFISREEIYNHCGGFGDEGEKEEYLRKAKEQYDKLVAYNKGNDFFDYVKECDEDYKNQREVVPNNPQNNPGCLLKFWKRKPQEMPASTPMLAPSSMLDNVVEIRKQLELKKEYKNFLSKVNEIEQAMKDEEVWCNKFKLTDHSHHYYHLIDLGKLKGYQKEQFDERFQQILKQWNGDVEKRELKQLKELLSQNTEKYTEKLKYIDWDKPFPFVPNVSDNDLADICDKLCKKSSPFVHYDKITATAVNSITFALYTDIPNIDKRFNNFKNNVTNSTNILPYHSTHIASKLCFFQFLPLDKDALDILCETNGNTPTAHDIESTSD